MITIDQNHTRLVALPDRRTADLFASGLESETLTLYGQSVAQGETFAERCERATAQRAADEPEQAILF
jgi:hypothetical protein